MTSPIVETFPGSAQIELEDLGEAVVCGAERSNPVRERQHRALLKQCMNNSEEMVRGVRDD